MKKTQSSLKSFGALTIKMAIVATAAVGGTALVSSSVFASLSANATNATGGAVESGTLRLTQVPGANTNTTAGLETAITGLAPNDVVHRFVTVKNAGTLDASSMTIGVIGSGGTLLTTDPTKGLQVTIKQCPTAYSTSGTCGSGETIVLSQRSVASLSTPDGLTLQTGSLLSNADSFLKLTISLPDSTEVSINGSVPSSTIQGLSTTLTWTFTTLQRAGNTDSN